ncbi:MAG: DUF2190 family protein [Candidatus Contendobacter sp.]|nr:DUF2190 family protein [Candidatus Contendobacter sp.]
MATNFVQDGDIVTYTNASTAILSGALVPLVNRAGIALVDIAGGASGSVQVEGIFTVPKTTGASWTIGQALYVDDLTGKATVVASDNVPAGFAAADATSGAATGNIALGGNLASGNPVATVVAAVAGTLTGTVDGTIADIAASGGACAGSASPSATNVDSAIATAVASIVTGTNTQHKELQTTLNAVIAALKAAGLMASA